MTRVTTISDLRAAVCLHGSAKKAATFKWFFKTGKGEYGEGDKFMGVTVPELRAIAKQYRHIPLAQLERLLRSPWHEERMIALFLLVHAFEKGDTAVRRRVYTLYCRNTRFVNNWDLVDCSAEYIVGAFLDGGSSNAVRTRAVLTRFARSRLLWERRIAIVATHYWIRRGSSAQALRVAAILVHDSHDLIHKAVGWMLREVGAHCSRAEEETFLRRHAATMPRTMLRYALEHFPASRRQQYMQAKK